MPDAKDLQDVIDGLTDTETGNTEEEATETNNDGTQRTDIAALPPDIQEYIKRLRGENKQRREALSEFETAAEQQRRAKLEEDEEYKTLVGELKTENATLAEYKKLYDEHIASVADQNVAFVEALSPQQQTLVPEYDDPLKLARWIEKNRAVLNSSQKKAPDTDAGASGQQKRDTGSFTPDEVAMFERLNLTVEEVNKLNQ